MEENEMKNVDIGIIGALSDEVAELISRLEGHSVERLGSIDFHLGELEGKSVVIAKCGVGKVFAAICAEAMIIGYSPRLIVNTGVGGALAKGLSVTDTVIADKLVQHDMDTSPIGDPIGLISGINKVWFETDGRAVEILLSAAKRLGLRAISASIASGDKFIADRADKEKIVTNFGASVCEMEGAAIAHTAFVNNTPFVVIRAISDSADESSSMDYMTFMPIAAKNSAALTLELVREY